jgi:hypothetical protein
LIIALLWPGPITAANCGTPSRANDLVYAATSVTKIVTNKPKKAGFRSKALRNVAVMRTGGGFRALVALSAIIFAAVAATRGFAQSGNGSDYEGPVGVTGIFNGNVATGCSYDPMTHSAKRTIDDIVVPRFDWKISAQNDALLQQQGAVLRDRIRAWLGGRIFVAGVERG